MGDGHITERAPAKLNLSLDVLGKLEGGYHALKMVMESVEFGDEVEITLTSGGEITLESDLNWLPRDGRNLACAAANVFRSALGDESMGVRLRIVKRIPVGAGMGGGSSDAAAVLRGLNRLCGRPFDGDGLRQLGLSIGSDVPYCIEGGSRLATGRGEELSPLPMPPACTVVIAKPSFSISTASLFSKIDGRSSRIHPDTAGLIAALEAGDLGGVSRRMFNVFEDVLPRSCREVGELRSTLLSCGAQGAVMTGTGSAVFGVFEARTDAEKAAAELKKLCRDVAVTGFVPEFEI